MSSKLLTRKSLIRPQCLCKPSVSAPSRRWMSMQELNDAKGDRERILILGSGWGGFGVARSLDKRYYQPIIVTPRTYFVFTPLLAGTAVGTLEFRTAMESSHSIKGAVTVRGWADSIDIANKTLQVEGAIETVLKNAPGGPRFSLDYDKLVIAVGSYAQTFGVPGVVDHAFFLKDVGDARRIRRRVLERFEEASIPIISDEKKRELLHFAIVGGGPTGIEFAAELHDLLSDDLFRIYPTLRKFAAITVYDVAPSILGMFDANLQAYAQKQFARQSIKILTSHHVVSVEEDAIVTKEQGRVPVGAVIWSTGLATNPFVKGALGKPFKLYESPDAEQMVVQKNPHSGTIKVDSHLRVLTKPIDNGGNPIPLPDIFSIGDCASVQDQTLPATAQVANQQAQYLAKVLNKAAARGPTPGVTTGRQLADVSDEKEFKFRSLGVMAYLGGWSAIMQTGQKGEVKGRLAWLLWRTAYFTKSLSWRNRILIPTYWFMNWILGRDINRF